MRVNIGMLIYSKLHGNQVDCESSNTDGQLLRFLFKCNPGINTNNERVY